MRISPTATSEPDFTDSRRSRDKFRVWWIFAALVLLGIVWFFFQLFGMTSSIVVSKETTFILEPLGTDGLPDFSAYLQNRASEGVTPENNAAVLTWQAMWPGELAQKHWLPMAEALGLKSIPSAQDSLVNVHHSSVRETIASWLVEQNSESTEGTDKFSSEDEFQEWCDVAAEELIDQSLDRPWRTEQCPPLADWVKNNQRPLDMLVEASKRPHYFSPSPSSFEGQDSSIVAMLLPGVQGMRSGVRALLARAMWHLGEGRNAACWQDLLACHRLPRLVAQGDFMVSQLVAIAIDSMACRGTVTLLHRGELPPKEVRQIFVALNEMSRVSSLERSSIESNRLMFIDAVIRMSKGKMDEQEIGSAGTDPLMAMSFVAFDWNFILREGNRWYDRLAETLGKTTREQRKVGFQEIQNDLVQLTTATKSPRAALSSMFNRKHRSKLVSNILISLLLPNVEAVKNAEDRGNTLLEMTRVAAALAVYRAEHDEYPEKLTDMVPGILPKMPLDMYSDQPFIYERKSDGGYVLYSVFENGVDDGGTDFGGEIVDGEWVEEQPENVDYGASDLVIRVPAPAFELPDPAKEEEW